MKKLILSFVLLVLFMPVYTVKSEPIPEDVNKCVAYIVKPENGDNQPIGTGFFIGFNYPEQADKYFVFLVTAKHVIYDEKGVLHPHLLVRMNSKLDGHLKDYDIVKNNNWFFHKDSNAVDIAVQPLLPKDAQFLFILSKDFVTEKTIEDNKIGIGDDVFYSGMLSYHSGREKVTPVVRFGRIALVTDEPTIDGRYYNFIDAGNIPGHSGSPVFLWASPSRRANALVAGSRIFGLYGVVSGVIEYTKELQVVLPKQTKINAIPVDSRNGGITAIIPVKYLNEILESDQVKKRLGLSQ